MVEKKKEKIHKDGEDDKTGQSSNDTEVGCCVGLPLGSLETASSSTHKLAETDRTNMT